MWCYQVCCFSSEFRFGFIKDNLRYETIAPVTFRVGDIVEAKATLMVLPLRGGNFKLTAVLRGITILDTTYTQV